jgi:hypothetical protein
MLLLGGTDDKNHANLDYEAVMQRYIAWSEQLRTSGRLVAAHKLEDGSGRRLSGATGKVTDGPYVETRESIGGYYIIEAKDFDEASRIARECPTVAVQNGFCEVRKIERS